MYVKLTFKFSFYNNTLIIFILENCLSYGYLYIYVRYLNSLNIIKDSLL